jgi:hypothetical protein
MGASYGGRAPERERRACGLSNPLAHPGYPEGASRLVDRQHDDAWWHGGDLLLLVVSVGFFGWMLIHPWSLTAILCWGRRKSITAGQLMLVCVIAGVSLVGGALSLLWYVVGQR